MTALIIALRLIHVATGAGWFGTALFTTRFLGPAIQEAGPAAGPVMGALQRRGMMNFMPRLATANMISGVALYWIVSDGFKPAYVHSHMGITFAIGALLAIAAFAYGMSVMRPSLMRAMALAQSAGASATEADKAEIARLRARAASASIVVLVMLSLAVAAMAIARYT
jgi:hypothetical protein